MSQPDKPCRLCVYFRRGKPRNAETWIKTYGACVVSGKAWPTHACERGCDNWTPVTIETESPKDRERVTLLFSVPKKLADDLQRKADWYNLTLRQAVHEALTDYLGKVEP